MVNVLLLFWWRVRCFTAPFVRTWRTWRWHSGTLRENRASERRRERDGVRCVSSAHHFGNLRSCSPAERGAHLPGPRGCGATEQLISQDTPTLFLHPLILSTIPLITVMVFFIFSTPAVSKWPAAGVYSALICASRGWQYVILGLTLRFWRSGLFRSLEFFFFHSVSVLLCRPEPILIHRDAVGLSELTAVYAIIWKLFAGKLNSFFHRDASKVALILMLQSLDEEKQSDGTNDSFGLRWHLVCSCLCLFWKRIRDLLHAALWCVFGASMFFSHLRMDRSRSFCFSCGLSLLSGSVWLQYDSKWTAEVFNKS